MAHCSTAALGYAAKLTCPITATTCFSGTRRGWGFRVLSCAAKAAFVSRRGEGARMGGVDAPPSARRLVLRSASRESSSVAHRAKEEVSSRVAASLRRIGSADPSPRLGSWSRVAPRLPQKTLKSQKFAITSANCVHLCKLAFTSSNLRLVLRTTRKIRDKLSHISVKAL